MKIQTLSVLVGSSACNAKCPYCISKMTPKQGIGLKKSKVNWRNFEKACRLAQLNNVTTVLLTGKGEPTLFPNQIIEFLKNIKKFNFPVIELQTNALLFEKQEYTKYLKEWYDLGLTIISISITHYDKEKNKRIFTPNSNYVDLEKIIEKLHKVGYSVRLSCTMFKGYIDNLNEVKKLIHNAKKWGVEQLSIRKLAQPKKSENKEVFYWAEKNLVEKNNLEEIKNFLEKNANKLMTLHHKSVVYDLEGQNICFTNALTIKPETDNLRQLIFFPDGHLRFDWQFKGAVLI